MRHYYIVTYQATIDYINTQTGTIGTTSPLKNPKPNVAKSNIEQYYKKKYSTENVIVSILSYPTVSAAVYKKASKDFIKK